MPINVYPQPLTLPKDQLTPSLVGLQTHVATGTPAGATAGVGRTTTTTWANQICVGTNDKVYVSSGFAPAAFPALWLWSFDPATGTGANLASPTSFPANQNQHGQMEPIANALLISDNQNAAYQQYNISNNTWSNLGLNGTTTVGQMFSDRSEKWYVSPQNNGTVFREFGLNGSNVGSDIQTDSYLNENRVTGYFTPATLPATNATPINDWIALNGTQSANGGRQGVSEHEVARVVRFKDTTSGYPYFQAMPYANVRGVIDASTTTGVDYPHRMKYIPNAGSWAYAGGDWLIGFPSNDQLFAFNLINRRTQRIADFSGITGASYQSNGRPQWTMSRPVYNAANQRFYSWSNRTGSLYSWALDFS